MTRRIRTIRIPHAARRPALLICLLATCGSAFTGCGYSLAGRGNFLPERIQRIGVPVFVNRTAVFNLESQVTEKVRAEFIGRGRYQILPEAAGADAVLAGEITSVQSDVASVTADNLASRYTITMVARVELRDSLDQKVLWENAGMVFRQEYESQTGASAVDPAAFFAQDANALDRLTGEFARTLVSAILEAF